MAKIIYVYNFTYTYGCNKIISKEKKENKEHRIKGDFYWGERRQKEGMEWNRWLHACY